MAKGRSGGGGSGAVRAGRAFVELFADDTKLTRTLDGWKKKLQSWGKSTAKIGAAIGAVGGGVLAPMTKMFADAVSRGADMDKLAKRFGTTTESVSVLASGFERAGAGAEGFSGFMDKMATEITAAADANQPLIENLQSMRRELDPHAMMRMKPEQWLDLMAEAIQRTSNDLDKLQLAQRFGLVEVLPQLKKGKAGVDELRKAGEKGLITTQQGERAKAILDAFTDAWTSAKSVILEVGLALFGTGGDIKAASEVIQRNMATAKDWVKDNQGLIVSIAKIAVGLVAAGAAVVVFGSVLGGLGSAIGGVATLIGGLLAVIGLVFSPAGLLIAGVVAAGIAFVELTDGGKKAFDDLTDFGDEFAHDFKSAWESIVDAFKRGDLESAFEVITASMGLAWAKVMQNMTKAWVDVKTEVAPAMDKKDSFLTKAILGWGWVLGIISRDEMSRMGEDIDKTIDVVASERPEKYKKELEDAEKNLEEAKGRLKKAIESSKTKEDEFRSRRRGGGGDWGDDRGRVGTGIYEIYEEAKANIRRMPDVFNAQKGVFSGPIAMQLGYGDQTMKRQLDAQENIARDVRVLPEINGKIGSFIASQRFK